MECGYEPTEVAWIQPGLFDAASGVPLASSRAAPPGLPFDNATTDQRMPGAALTGIYHFHDQGSLHAIGIHLSPDGMLTLTGLAGASSMEAHATAFLANVSAADDATRAAWVESLMANGTVETRQRQERDPTGPGTLREVQERTYIARIRPPYAIDAIWDAVQPEERFEAALTAGPPGGVTVHAGPWLFRFALPTAIVQEQDLLFEVDSADRARVRGSTGAASDEQYLADVQDRAHAWDLPPLEATLGDVSGSVC